MSITAAIVLFAMTWFMVFFIVLPIRHVSQADTGKVEPGTPRGAPATEVVGRKAKITTLVAIVVWALLAGIIQSGVITIRDLDFRGVLHAPTE
ncbi:MAG: hypothetical protein RIT14_2273 [Pseudomonadota bacterium]|jgi:predicted secreted protein